MALFAVCQVSLCSSAILHVKEPLRQGTHPNPVHCRPAHTGKAQLVLRRLSSTWEGLAALCKHWFSHFPWNTNGLVAQVVVNSSLDPDDGLNYDFVTHALLSNGLFRIQISFHSN